MATWYNIKMNYNDEKYSTYLMFFDLGGFYLQFMVDTKRPQYINWGLEDQEMMDNLEDYADSDPHRTMTEKVYSPGSKDLREIFKYVFTSFGKNLYDNEYNRGNSSGQWAMG